MAKNDNGGSPNLSLVAAAIDGAEPAPKVGRSPRRSPAPDELEHQLEIPMLPPGCPIEALGKLGLLFYYLDEAKQLIELHAKEHNKSHILALFGRKFKLCHEFWPRYSDKTGADGKPIVTGWKSEIAGELLMGVCAQEGIFDPQGKVRGTGAHRAPGGGLVLHCGNKIFLTEGHRYVDPGLIGGYVYPAGPSRPQPDENAQTAAPGEQLLMMLRAWNWQRPTIDPMLLLGHIGCSMLGGALDWRPHAWITGGSATGKSTLQKLLRAVHGGAALSTGSATEAALRQLLKQQTLPVFFDELEAQEDNRKSKAVIELARVASSGDQILKGGQNHQGAEFTVRSCFLFSSILLPPMMQQDRNRLAILELDPIEDLERAEDGQAPKGPTIEIDKLAAVGRQVRRRLVDHWDRLDDLVERYKVALGMRGHSGRSGDQFGTLLAVADVMLYDELDEATINFWANELDARNLSEKVTEIADEEAVVQHLATSILKSRGGDEPEPVIRAIAASLQPDGDKYRQRLENVGLRIVEKTISAKGNVGGKTPSSTTAAADLYLAIANNHVALSVMFDNTQWSQGTWTQSFGRVRFKIAGADDEAPIVRKAERRAKIRFGPGQALWATLIPLPAILDLSPQD